MLPGKFGAPIIGAISAGLLIEAARIVAEDRYNHWIVPVACVVAILVALFIGGRLFIGLPILRATGTNVEATRGTSPRVWLVAHVDSKSQPVSTAVRTLGAILLALAAAIGVAGSLTTMPGRHHIVWIAVVILATGGAIPLIFSTVGTGSDGAADNASGVAAVLEAVSLVPPEVSLGVLISDAEELALAGARRWVRGRSPAIAINCDTIAGEGRCVVMRYGDRIGLADRAIAAARAEDTSAIRIRPLPGVLTDSVAFREAGWATVTLSRGTLRTLNRIHTARDNLLVLDNSGIPIAARILSRLVKELA